MTSNVALAVGYYCGLHSYQKPRVAPDGSTVFDSTLLEAHVRRTSFAPQEAALVAELLKAPGIVRDRPGARSSASGQTILNWLLERRLDPDSARATAQRMVSYELLVPTGDNGGGGKPGTFNLGALYRVQAMPVAPSLP